MPLSVSEKGNRGTIPILSTLIMEYYSIFWRKMSSGIIYFTSLQLLHIFKARQNITLNYFNKRT